MIRLLRALPIAVAACLTWAAAGAQDYPNRPVKIIVPFGAGGPADIFSRVLAQYLSEALKQSFVVEDRPGAGSVIGTDAVAKSAPDGYTLLAMSNTHTTNESLMPNKPFQLMRDFVPVAPINYSDLVMVMHPSVPAKDLKEFIALAKAKPGALNYASSGPGTPYHMAGELFKAMSGTNIVHVPHKALRRSAQQRARRPRADDVRRHHRRWPRTCRPGRCARSAPPATSARRCCRMCRRSPRRACPATRRRSGSASWRRPARRKPIVDKLNAEINEMISRPDLRAPGPSRAPCRCS